jgi:hypothetical protein
MRVARIQRDMSARISAALILKRVSASRPSAHRRDDDFVVLQT